MEAVPDGDDSACLLAGEVSAAKTALDPSYCSACIGMGVISNRMLSIGPAPTACLSA